MRRPVAATFLSRVIHMTGPGSLARAVDEGRLELVKSSPDDELVLSELKALAREDRSIGEEARALASGRQWPADLAGQPYGWVRLRNETAKGALPRILRILEREVFELEGDARESGDDDVASLVVATLDARKTAHGALASLAPADTLPGAK